MILIFGALLDSGIAHLVHRLVDRNLPFLMLDPREHGRDYDLSWEWTNGQFHAWLRRDGSKIPLDDVHSVYVHHILLPHVSADGRLTRQESHQILHAFLETAPFVVCNRPSCSATNYAKTWQQQTIADCGFMVPRTLATNIPGEARDFYERCRRRVIYKSLSARRSIVRRMNDDDLGRLGMLDAGPTQFQEWIPGVDVRVHVMGGRIYATEIATDAVDYRYANRDSLTRSMRGIHLPDDVSARCAQVAASLGLVCAGVDLRRTPEGVYYCFEANPTPGFAFYEQYTGQRIADGLIDALLDDIPTRRQ